MQLFLIRHAQPTARGARRWRRAVRGLQHLGLRFDRLYHSPRLRALRTAERIHRLVRGETAVLAELVGSPSASLLEALRGERVAVVGHDPWLSELLSLLTHGSAALHAHFALRRGGVAWLEGEVRPGEMRLRGLFTPQLLRRAGP